MTSVVHLLAPAKVGGLESVVASLAAGQLGRGREVTVGAIVEPDGAPHPFVESLREAEVPHRVLRIPPRRYLREAREIGTLLARLDPAVVHTHGYRADVIAGHVAATQDRPLASTVHGFTGGGLKNRMYEVMQRVSMRRFDAVVAVSAPLGEELTSWGVDPDRLHVIPNAWAGGGELLDREEARRRLDLPDGAWVIGWVGRLERLKGGDVLLEALAHLPAEDVVASVIGDGSEGVALRRKARELGIDDRVRFHGLVPRAAALYPAFDAFVLSSRSEGTPVSLFEALNAGVPVVASRVGGVPDVVGPEEALLTPPDAPGAVAAALERIRSRPQEAKARARRGRERLEREFGTERWLDRYARVYRRIHAHRPSEESR